MPDTTTDPVATVLEESRALGREYVAAPGPLGQLGREVLLLRDALEAVLAQHQPGRIVVLGALCPKHENHRHFSITSTEAASVMDCRECAATVYDSCAGCGPQVRLDSCPVRSAISASLLGQGDA